jgi:uncharacterized coiled-coil protein SlyX
MRPLLIHAGWVSSQGTGADESLEKRIKDLETNLSAREKRVTEVEKAPREIGQRIKDLEKRLADSEKARQELST